MKKKKIVLDRKLLLSKATIANLGKSQQTALAGGTGPSEMCSYGITCFGGGDTCATFQQGSPDCRFCN
ncbi:class I lanthipeptide [Chitinophaga nivalis]|uniref:Class I lanthipeptide n=1 Tax=Chitinophaga nivalis TaxID=2991709 RepID=A0ABT3ILB4_9BACT|nr:class I lanthipeptide [Chitinophaga nivalis]MCW3465554.1 class I lanthipeptide [Chitinophaga nivalis]MCW3484755.1 class I lanthipeptide [Chitinophaga nivalis]